MKNHSAYVFFDKCQYGILTAFLSVVALAFGGIVGFFFYHTYIWAAHQSTLAAIFAALCITLATLFLVTTAGLALFQDEDPKQPKAWLLAPPPHSHTLPEPPRNPKLWG